ncbi:MAG: Ldh family oxidoreductase [Deltaproteobacteria bacterium]|nr:Ldh family oxidoreductase [Deltaproteobacteria bacterium]
MDSITMSIDEALALCQKALVASGTEEKNAQLVAGALLRAEAEGQKGHGLSRVPSYCAQVRTGKVNGRAVPVVEDIKPGLVRVDAGFGFAYPAIELALPELAARAKTVGIAAAAIYHSHHFGVAGHPCEDLAQKDLLAFVYGNTPSALAPAGAKKKVLGTNPIAFGAPQAGAPLIIDFAVSTVARGKIMAAKQAGKNIPEGWALGPNGKPTTDADEALRGSMLPIGGVKGAALALLVEVMSACLAGAALGVEASSLFDPDGAPPNLGQVILAIDAEALSGGHFSPRLVDLAAVYNSIEGARFPGLKRLQNRRKAEEDGLSVPIALAGEIMKLAT